MRPSIKSDLVKLAAYYEKTLSPEQIAIYSEQLAQNLTDQECSMACRLYINDPNNEWFPKPVSKLIALIKKPVSIEDTATLIASLIIATSREFDFGSGWAEGFFQAGERVFKGKDCLYTRWDYAALSKLGEMGLGVVKAFGNWESVCRFVLESPEGVARAQLSKLAVSIQNVDQKTCELRSITGGRSSGELTQASNVLEFMKSKNNLTPEGEK